MKIAPMLKTVWRNRYVLLALVASAPPAFARPVAQGKPLITIKIPDCKTVVHREQADQLRGPLTEKLGEVFRACEELRLAPPTDMRLFMLEEKHLAKEPRLKVFDDHIGPVGSGATTVGGVSAYVSLANADPMTEAKRDSVVGMAVKEVKNAISLMSDKFRVAIGPASLVVNLIDAQIALGARVPKGETRKVPETVVAAATLLQDRVDQGKSISAFYVELLAVMRKDEFRIKAEAEALSVVLPYVMLESAKKAKNRAKLATALVQLVQGTSSTDKNNGEEVAKLFSKGIVTAVGIKVKKKGTEAEALCQAVTLAIPELAGKK